MNKSKKAFTLVELMLAVAFLGTLLLSIALLTMQLINIYTKGATMRAINTTGSTIMKDIRTAISSSNNKPENLDSELDTYYWINDERSGKSTGMFCTGSYTYVWNYQNAMMQEYRGASTSYRVTRIKVGTDSEIAYGLARIKDSSCDLFNEAKTDTNTTISLNNKEELNVLLDGRKSGDGTDLALYDFSVISATRSSGLSGKGLYDISFVLGTMRGGIDVGSSSNYCKTNEGGRAGDAAIQSYSDVSMDYCSVNRFEFAVRQSGMKF